MDSALGVVAFILVLGVIGWGLGFAAAMGWRAITGTSLEQRQLWVLRVVLALVIALAAAYSYVIVLKSVGLVDNCDMRLPTQHAC